MFPKYFRSRLGEEYVAQVSDSLLIAVYTSNGVKNIATITSKSPSFVATVTEVEESFERIHFTDFLDVLTVSLLDLQRSIFLLKAVHETSESKN